MFIRSTIKSGFHQPMHTFWLALLAAVLISGCGFWVDHLVHKADRLLASDFYTCIIAFIFSFALLQLEARRRSHLARRMEIAAEVNHHIRNALTGVIYTAAVRNDPALEAVLHDATVRIDWVLNTVLPDGSKDLQWPVQVPSWKPVPWRDPMSEGEPKPVRTPQPNAIATGTSHAQRPPSF